MVNDFLGNLSSRAMHKNEQDTVTGRFVPRLASRFESGIRPVLPAVDQASDVEVPVGVETRRVEAGGAQPSRMEEPPPVHTGPPRSRRKEDSQMARQDADPIVHQAVSVRTKDGSEAASVPVSSAQVEPSKPPERLEEHASDVQAILVRVSQSLPPRAEPQGSSVFTARPGSGGLLPAPSVSMDRKNDPDAESPPQAIPATPTVDLPERVENHRIESQLPVSDLRSRLVPSLALPDYRPQKTMTENRVEPPTIHVTIGRVEVKATAPGAPPKRPAARPVTMSLDDYLQQRQGGNR